MYLECLLREFKLENLNVNKSIGVDRVHAYVLKHCSKPLAYPYY